MVVRSWEIATIQLFFYLNQYVSYSSYTSRFVFIYKKRIVANMWIKTPTQDLCKIKPVNNFSMEWGGTPKAAALSEELLAIDRS